MSFKKITQYKSVSTEKLLSFLLLAFVPVSFLWDIHHDWFLGQPSTNIPIHKHLYIAALAMFILVVEVYQLN